MYSQLSKYTGQGCPQNATVAPGHSTMKYNPTSTVINQDNNTICFHTHRRINPLNAAPENARGQIMSPCR